MTTITKKALIVLLAIVFASCSQNENFDGPQKEKIVREVTEMFNDYHNDIKVDGLIAEFNYLDESSDFFWVPPGYNSALSYDSVKSILELNHQSFQSIEFSWDTLQIFPLSDKIASYSGIVHGIMTDTSGLVNTVRIIESGTVIKRGSSWKILNGQSATLN